MKVRRKDQAPTAPVVSSPLRSVALAVVLAVVACGLYATACSSSGGTRPSDAAQRDGFTIDYRFGDLPPGCPPTGGNDKNVGAPCIKGSNKDQCGGGMICACDEFNGFIPPEDTPCFCTLAILNACTAVPSGYCGRSASCCSYMDIASVCVPDVCLNAMGCPTF